MAAATACAPSTRRIENADYSAPVLQGDAELVASEYLRRSLKDPHSAQIEFAEVRKGWLRESLLGGGRVHFGWVLHAHVNARNSFGGYVGYRRWAFLFRDGQLAVVFRETVVDGNVLFVRTS